MSKDKQILENSKELIQRTTEFEKIQKRIVESEEEFLSIGDKILKNFGERYEQTKKDYDISKSAVDNVKDRIDAQMELSKAYAKSHEDEFRGRMEIEDIAKVAYKQRVSEINETKDQISELQKSIERNLKNNDTFSADVNKKSISRLRDYMKGQMDSKKIAEEQLNIEKEKTAELMTYHVNLKKMDDETHANLSKQLISAEEQKSLGKEKLKNMSDVNSILSRHTGIISDISNLTKIATSPWLLLYFSLKSIIERFFELDNAAGAFRKETGLSITQMAKIREIAEETNVQYRAYGVSIKDAYDASNSLMKSFGNMNQLSTELVKSTALFTKNLGVSSEDAAGFLASMKQIGLYSDKQARSAGEFSAKLAEASGIPLSLIMKDVANASEEARSMVGGIPDRLIKASAAARRLGVELNTSAKSARGLLEFDQSINNELEASVLAGKNINFMEARRLAFAGDIAGAQESILKTVQGIGDFNKLNVLQQEAIAKAAGYSVTDMQKMLQNQKAINEGTYEQRSEYEKLMKMKSADVKVTLDQLILQKKQQTVQENFSNAIASLGDSFTTIFTPLLGWIVKIVSLMADGAQKIAEWSIGIGKVGTGIITLGGAILGIWGTLKLIKASGGFIGSIMGSTKSIASAPGALIKSVFGGLASGLKSFTTIPWSAVIKGAAAIALLGIAIIPFAYSMKMFGDVKWSDVFIGLGALAAFAVVGGIMGAFLPVMAAGALAIALLGVSLIPFAYAAGLAGEGMVKLGEGFSSIVPQLGELAVLAPGLMATAAAITALSISMAAFGYGQVANGLGSFVGGLLGGDQLSKFKALAELGPKLEVTADAISKINGSTVLTETRKQKDSSTSTSNGTTSNDEVVKKLDELINLMRAGGISVQLDGRKVSRELASSIS